MPIPIGSIKPGKAIVYNDDVYIVTHCEHSKLARGGAFCRTKLKNLKSGQTKECTLRDSDKVEDAFIEKRALQFSYHDGDIFHFMDMETYEDLILDKDIIGGDEVYLKDNLELVGLFYDNRLVSFEMPSSVELKITETNPGVKGDTVKMATKAAKLETGLDIQVPLFIEPGETIKVDTRTGAYLGRA